MDPSTIAALASVLSTMYGASQGGGDVQQGAPTAGGQPQQTPIFGQQQQMPQQSPDLIPQDGFAALVQQAQQANSPPSPVLNQKPTPLMAPGTEPGGTDTPPEEASIGTILAAVPGALSAVAPLLGMGQQQIAPRLAPIAGGQGGQVVGQFGNSFGGQMDIGRLLASLPGIR